MTINGNDIRMIRGDTEQLVVTCQLSDGTERPFEDGDTVTLTVAWPMGREVLQKTVTSLYYRVVVIRAPLQGLCYTVRDAVDWCVPPTTRWFQKGSNHSPLHFC